MIKKQDILLFSVPRTGSTLVYNVLREIFSSENVRAVHSYEIPHNLIVISYRDIRDSIASWRTRDLKRKTINPMKKMSLLEIIRYYFWAKRYLRIQRRYEILNKKILWLRYERFYNDYEYLYDRIEDYFFINISKEMRKKITKDNNVKKAYDVSMSVLGKKEHDEITRLSKYHVNNIDPGYWKKIVPKRYWLLNYMIFRRDLLNYGYGRDF